MSANLTRPVLAPVAEWRRRLLERAGSATELAAPAAGDAAVDVPGLLVLAERGCPPALAVRVPAPDERPQPEAS